jgi:hypothetical protein
MANKLVVGRVSHVTGKVGYLKGVDGSGCVWNEDYNLAMQTERVGTASAWQIMAKQSEGLDVFDYVVFELKFVAVPYETRHYTKGEKEG